MERRVNTVCMSCSFNLVDIMYCEYSWIHITTAAFLHFSQIWFLIYSSTLSQFSMKYLYIYCNSLKLLTYLQYSLLQTAIETCQKKTMCQFVAAPKSLDGNPCPDVRRLIYFAYKCRPCKFFMWFYRLSHAKANHYMSIWPLRKWSITWSVHFYLIFMCNSSFVWCRH